MGGQTVVQRPVAHRLDMDAIALQTLVAGAVALVDSDADPRFFEPLSQTKAAETATGYNPMKVWSGGRMTGTGHMRHATGSRVQSTRRGEQFSWTRPP